MQKEKAIKRKLPCECCGIEIEIRERDRFLAMVRSRENPFCEQCRRYETVAATRVTQVLAPSEDFGLALVLPAQKVGKKRAPLASAKLKRCRIAS